MDLLSLILSAVPGDPGAPDAAGITSGIPWKTIVEGIFSVVGMGLAWLFARMKSNSDQSTAQGQIIVYAEMVKTGVWERLTPEVQEQIAVGNWKPFEGAIAKGVQDALVAAVGQGALQKVAQALKLPLGSLVATVAQYVIEHFLAAHDPEVTTVSANVYPVKGARTAAQMMRAAPTVTTTTAPAIDSETTEMNARP